MWDEILRLAIGNGLWAVLFCCLLVYQLRDSRGREGKYQKTIASLCDRLGTVEDIKQTAEQTLQLVRVKKDKAATPAAAKREAAHDI